MSILSNVNGKFAVDSTGAVQFSGAAGTSGYVLKSNGSGSAPTWVDVSTVIGGPYLPLSGGTLTGATATASGISFTVGGVLTANDTSKIEKAQITTQFDTSSFLRLHPSATTNSGGFTNMIFGTDTANNYGVAIGGKREGTDGTPTFSIRMLDDSITGTEVLNISNSGNATFAGNVILGDTPQIQLGTGNDAQIDHTGSHLFIDNSVGNSYLRNTSTGSIIIRNGTGGDIQFDNEFAGNILFNTSNITRLTIDSSGNATFAGSATIPTMAGNPNFTGDIYQYGRIFRNDSFIDVVGNTNSKIELQTAYFTHTVSNQAVNIQFPNVAAQGYYKITLSGSYSHQDISGKLTKVIPFGYNPNGSIWRTGNAQSEITIATGGVSTNFTIGNLAWDSTNSKFIVPIYKLTSTGNSVRILIEYFGGAANNLKDVSLSSNYTQTAPSPFNVRQYQNIRDRLGIGTASPSTTLDVAGIIRIAESGNTAFYGGDYVRLFGTQAFRFLNTGGSAIAQVSLTGNSYFNGGNVGIGTTSPQSKLDLVQPDSSANTLGQSVTASLGIRMANAVGQVGQIVFNNDAAPSYGYGSIGMIMTSGSGVGLGDMIFATKSTGADNASTERIRITSGGRVQMTADVTMSGSVGIGETTLQRKFNLYDGTDTWTRVQCGASTADWLHGIAGSDHTYKWYNQSSNGGVGYKMALATSGTLTVSADLVAYGSPSDKRLKENIKPIESALDKVSKLQGVTFDWKEKGITNLKKDIGFIAQDVQKVIPELVRKNENELLSMRHQGVIPILVEAIKELEVRIKELENK